MTPTPLTSRAAGWVIFILALGAGFSVASIYYAQPLLPLMGANLHLSVEGMGLVPTLTQAGYALGILFLLPLGDRHDRRKLILMKSAALAVLLLLCSLTGQLSSLLIVKPAYRYGRDHGAGISYRQPRFWLPRASRGKWWVR
ncbi:MFS permease protein [Klebsiella michiganensis]|nr:MFS permease protein [Klebsiella michiganensis]